MKPDRVEVRVLGCLIEKQRTTPDAYPLSLNSLRLACNQSTNRSPVVDYDERTIREALQRLAQSRLTRLASDAGSRAAKYRHLLGEPPLSLTPPQLSILAVLMLRGPQTPGELKTRTERMHPFAGLDAVTDTLATLAERRLARRLDRAPGQKEERWVQTLGEAEAAAEPPPSAPFTPSAQAPAAEPEEPDRLAALEERVNRLEAQMAALLRGHDEAG